MERLSKAATQGVFPTHVGVFLNCGADALNEFSLPHARGGVSLFHVHVKKVYKVFPTHVGVFLIISSGSLSSVGLPHARGGVSAVKEAQKIMGESSPRTWGCFPRNAGSIL